MEAIPRRILIVSNRLPISVRRSGGHLSVEASAGGLATGLAGVHGNAESVWIGWPGHSEALTPAETESLARGYTDAICIVHDGRIVFEHYVDGMRPDDTHLLMSVSKSLTATLVGVLVGERALDPGAQVTAYVGALRGTAWEGCTVQHLLDTRRDALRRGGPLGPGQRRRRARGGLRLPPTPP